MEVIHELPRERRREKNGKGRKKVNIRERVKVSEWGDAQEE